MITCPNHQPIWIPAGRLCFACLVFYPAKGQELRPSYRTPPAAAPPPPQADLFDAEGDE